MLTPERQVMLWVEPLRPEYFQPGTFPVVYMHASEGSFYALPSHQGSGVKFGKYHHLGQRVDPDAMDRECHPEDERVLREGVRRYFPDADGPTLAMKTCLFTNTPDEHFIITRLAGAPITVAYAAGSGGTGAGIQLGLRLLGWREAKAIGFAVCNDAGYFREAIAGICAEARRRWPELPEGSP